jgi:hypothetical protein
MTSNYVYTPTQTSKRNASTMSFGAHRQMDLPASAIRAGASTMPRAWQTRGVPDHNGDFQYGAPVRTIGDIMADPLRRALATTPRKIACAGIVCMTVLTYLF